LAAQQNPEEIKMNMRRALLALAAFALAIGIAPVVAAQDSQPAAPPQQQPTTAPPPEAQAPAQPADTMASDKATQKIEGELLSVDDAAKTLSVKTADGQEVKIAYTDQTEISGAKDQAAGLATATGSKVSVTFKGEGEARTATKIKITPKE
jgi:hypothetical protein